MFQIFKRFVKSKSAHSYTDLSKLSPSELSKFTVKELISKEHRFENFDDFLDENVDIIKPKQGSGNYFAISKSTVKDTSDRSKDYYKHKIHISVDYLDDKNCQKAWQLALEELIDNEGVAAVKFPGSGSIKQIHQDPQSNKYQKGKGLTIYLASKELLERSGHKNITDDELKQLHFKAMLKIEQKLKQLDVKPEKDNKDNIVSPKNEHSCDNIGLTTGMIFVSPSAYDESGNYILADQRTLENAHPYQHQYDIHLSMEQNSPVQTDSSLALSTADPINSSNYSLDESFEMTTNQLRQEFDNNTKLDSNLQAKKLFLGFITEIESAIYTHQLDEQTQIEIAGVYSACCHDILREFKKDEPDLTHALSKIKENIDHIATHPKMQNPANEQFKKNAEIYSSIIDAHLLENSPKIQKEKYQALINEGNQLIEKHTHTIKKLESNNTFKSLHFFSSSRQQNINARKSALETFKNKTNRLVTMADTYQLRAHHLNQYKIDLDEFKIENSKLSKDPLSTLQNKTKKFKEKHFTSKSQGSKKSLLDKMRRRTRR